MVVVRLVSSENSAVISINEVNLWRPG